jgi:L-ribulose-5-phosphate 3-epimerase
LKKYTIGLYEKAMPKSLNWRQMLECAKECGYDFVEISIDETDFRLSRLEWTKEDRLELVNTMKEIGIPIRTMCLSGHRKYPFGASDPAVRARGMEIMEKAIELADDLGIRIIQLAGYDVYYEEGNEETRARFERNLKKATLMAATAGVVIGFETMETEFMNTVEKSMYYVNKVNNPYLGVYPDMGNITNAAVSYGKNVLDDIRTGEGHMFAAHLKETVPGVFREVPFGTGHVDFPAVIKACWEAGIRRYVTEMWYIGSPEWRKDLDEAVGMMRPILDAME